MLQKSEVLKYEPIVLNGNSKATRSLPKQLSELLAVLTNMEETLKGLEISQQAVFDREKEIHDIVEQIGTGFNAFSLESSFLANQLEAIGECHDNLTATLDGTLHAQLKLAEAVHELNSFTAAVKLAINNYSIRQSDYDLLSTKSNQTRSRMLQTTADPERSNSPALNALEEDEASMARELEQVKQMILMAVSSWLSSSRTQYHMNLIQRAKLMCDQSKASVRDWNELSKV